MVLIDLQKFHLAGHCAGVVVGPAGALAPYRVITAIWQRLLREHRSRYSSISRLSVRPHTLHSFSLFSHTPCTSILEPSGPSGLYTLTTSRGTITTPHVVHASNAHVSHLLPKMREKIIASRATCSAQRPGQASSPSTRDGGRSWLLKHKRGFDYLSQLPSSPDGRLGTLILGGGFSLGEDGLGEGGRADDDNVDPLIRAYLGGALPVIFGEGNWGAEAAAAPADDHDGWHPGRVKAVWSGVIGVSADGHPWVGRVPPRLAGRAPPAGRADAKTASAGEWIAAGYSGDGMTAALLCGRALAYMILGREREFEVDDWLPEPFIITEARWANANVEDLVADAKA